MSVNCDEKCICGCQDDKKNTCDETCECGCSEETCNCNSDCECGCNKTLEHE